MEHKLDIKIDENIEPRIVRICALLTLKDNAKSENFKGIMYEFDNVYVKFKSNWFKALFRKTNKTTIYITQSIHIEDSKFNNFRPKKEWVIADLKKYLPYAEIEVKENWVPFDNKQYKL